MSQAHRDLFFVLGGARSGKSAYALHLAERSALTCVYAATAQALDEEMAARIAHHKENRAHTWDVVEEPIELADKISENTREDRIILVDCLTLWLSNIMHTEEDISDRHSSLVTTLSQRRGPVILVSNELGMGLVPETRLGREFRDAQGRLNQTVARAADHVTFVAAGLPLHLKGNADAAF